MTDILTPAQRSALMAKVRSSGNASTELRLVAVFRALGVTGWRRGTVKIIAAAKELGFAEKPWIRRSASPNDAHADGGRAPG